MKIIFLLLIKTENCSLTILPFYILCVNNVINSLVKVIISCSTGTDITAPALLLTERYEELSVASALIRWECEDTCHIIPIWRLFLLKNKGNE